MVEAWLFSTKSCDALLAARVAGQPAGLAELLEPALATGDDLVHVRLVAGVPQDRVGGRVEHAVQRERQLDGAEVATRGGRRSRRPPARRSRGSRRPARRARRSSMPAGLQADGSRAATWRTRGYRPPYMPRYSGGISAVGRGECWRSLSVRRSGSGRHRRANRATRPAVAVAGRERSTASRSSSCSTGPRASASPRWSTGS